MIFKIGFFFSSLIHLFPWSGIIDENLELSETFLVPDIKSGKMVRLLTQLSSKEEEMFRNMIRRINVLAQVRGNFYWTIWTNLNNSVIMS